MELLLAEPSISFNSSDRQSMDGGDRGDEDRELGGFFERFDDALGRHGVLGGLGDFCVLMVGLVGGLPHLLVIMFLGEGG